MLKLSASLMSINRLKAVRRYQILGTPPEEAFDRITRLASDIFDTPVALLNIATGRRSLWCKSATGWDCAGTHIQTPPCEYAMNQHDLTVVEDIATDERFASCSLAATAPNVRFYAGAPLHTPDGVCIGTLCVLAPNPRSFSDTDADRLHLLADLAVDLLEKRSPLDNTHSASLKNRSESSSLLPPHSLKEQAHKFTRLKESVLTNMSHEVRTPLTAMIGFAEILTEELDSPLAEHAAVIYRCGKRLHRTLDSMMQLSKLEGGVYTLNRRHVDLCKVVHNVVESMNESAHAQDIHVAIETPSAPVCAYADAEAVSRVVTNILDNAIKFTPNSGRVWVRVHTKGFSGACIEVEDTGVGISESAISTVFAAFKQESEGISRMYEGIGLGLTIVRGLVEMMKGVVRIESQKGVGTHVAVHLPTAPHNTGQSMS
ncbi:GAF domain-containing sensor histidine kinase [Longimonas halophila]|nr:GAF domain-containing sensor histidine kinase [Longimonas halophila]